MYTYIYMYTVYVYIYIYIYMELWVCRYVETTYCTTIFGSGQPYKWPLSNGPAPAFDTLEVLLPPQAFGNAMWRRAFRTTACNDHGAVAPAAGRVGCGQFGCQPGRSRQEETQ